MNIYDMLIFIRKNDRSAGRAYTFTADFLNTRYMEGTIESEDLFGYLQSLMILIVIYMSYAKEEEYNVRKT